MDSLFITYRWDDEYHKNRVREFAETLRTQLEPRGVNIIFDRFLPGGPDGDWAGWLEKQISKASRVLIVATASWTDSYDGTRTPDGGGGVAWEANIIRQHLYHSQNWAKFRVVLFDPADASSIPYALKGLHHFNAGTDNAEIVAWASSRAADPDPTAPTSAGSFPKDPPEISWPLADGLEVRRAVEGVLCAESESRIVLVRGESGRGKTETCRVLWEQGMQFEWLRCGRLDLKGASKLDQPVQDFIADLRAEKLLPANPSGGALDRISGLIAALDRAPQPTLLVFDNFELGGDFSGWVERVLPAVKRREWLRVVVAGQKVPAFATATWGGPAFRPVVLECIPVVDWVEFGQRFKKDLPAQEVEAVYKASKGDHQLMRMLVENLCGIGS